MPQNEKFIVAVVDKSLNREKRYIKYCLFLYPLSLAIILQFIFKVK